MKSWFFKKISNIENPLAKSTKRKEEDPNQLLLLFSNCFIIHMCIQCLGHFSPLPPPPPLPPTPPPPSLLPPPQNPTESILPLSLILLKREYKQ
jgi:hypothetical protein